MISMSDPDPRSESTAAAPVLSGQQFARLLSYGTPEPVAVGDVVFSAGDIAYDLVVIEEGVVEIVREATRDAPEAVVARHGAGRFLGELNMLTGQTVYLTARVVEAGRIVRIPPDRFRRIMAREPELSNLLLRAFEARRLLLRETASRSVEIVGIESSAQSLALRSYAARLGLPHLWFDAESVAGLALMRLADVTTLDLPVALVPGRILSHAHSSSPYFASGTPTTCTSSMSGCV